MIYLLLPAYNEEEDIQFLVPKVDKFFKESLATEYMIIACNDGSKDRTLELLNKYKSDGVPITILDHKINRGLGETIRDLFEKAAEMAGPEDIIIRMDCDDTHEPEYIKGLIDQINNGYDVVIASRFVEGGGQLGLNWYRRTISLAANRFMKLWFPIKGLKEYSSGFRAYKGSIVIQAVNTFGNNFIQLKGLGFSCTLEKIVKLKMLGAKFGEAPMVLNYGQKRGESKMVGSITTLGYLVLVLMYHWPFGGWKRQFKKKGYI
ncbi:MAG: glycosyltransferase [Bacteroidia bacterium]|nr:glycosyltransferase [Bacteroidia bacterium]